MQLAVLIAMLAALAHSEQTQPQPVAGSLWRVGLTIAAALLAPLLAGIASIPVTWATAKEDCCDRRDRAVLLQRLAVGVWLAACAVVLYGLEWPSIVRANWSLDRWPIVDDLCILAPIVLPLLLLWLAFYQVERAGQIAIARASGTPAPPASAASYIALQARHQLALILLPALVVIAVQDGLASFAPRWPALENLWWLGLPLIAALVVLLPLVLRVVWRTSPLPAGELRTRLEEVCRQGRCRLRDILIWHTDGGVANAAIAGTTPWLRYVFLSDGLMRQLTDDELAAVLAHELGHAQRHHLPLRMLLLTLPLVVLLAVQAWMPDLGYMVQAALSEAGVSEDLQTSLLLPILVLAYSVLAVGRYSRRLEHDADLSVILHSRMGDAAAAQHFATALRKLTPHRESRLGAWLHPSLSQRLDLLSRAQRDVNAGWRFRRRLDVFAGLLLAAYALAVAALLIA